jgi:hypothetical protein
MKKHIIKILSAAVVALVALAVSCGGGKSWLEDLFPDVHIVGFEQNARGNRVATYWKNKDKGISLSDGTSNAGAMDVKIAPNGDVYVVGVVNQEEGDGYETMGIIRVWKNGVKLYDLNDADSPGIARCIVLKGNDVYVAGYVDAYWVEYDDWFIDGYVWKNGKAHYWYEDCLVNSVFVTDNGSIYASGAEYYYNPFFNSYGFFVGAVWKDLEPAIYLTDNKPLTGPNFIASRAFSVHVSGGKVYAAGFNNILTNAVTGSYERAARLWVDGAMQDLGTPATTSANWSSASGVYTSGNDVFVALYEVVDGKRLARYWKKGEGLVNLGDGATFTVVADNNNVYVVGNRTARNSNNAVTNDAGYWINSTGFSIKSESKLAYAWSITVD